MPASLPPPGTPESALPVTAGTAPLRSCLLTVWSTGVAGFAARAVMPDGTLHDFTSPFELARFLSSPVATPAAPGPAGSGLR